MQLNLLQIAIWFMLTSSFSQTLEASIMRYLGNYKLGINLIGSNDAVEVAYDIDATHPAARSCEQKSSDVSKYTCRETISDPGQGLGSEYLQGFGIFLQQPFRKQGFWYFGADISFGLQVASNQLPEKRSELNGRPLKSLEYSLYGVRMRPYLQFGITPNGFPDILISFGPVLQTIAGTVTVNEESQDTGLAQTSRLKPTLNPLGWAYVELEVVFWRYRHAAFSWYTARAAVDDSEAEGEFYPGEIDGMENFKASFRSNEGGFKLLFNFP